MDNAGCRPTDWRHTAARLGDAKAAIIDLDHIPVFAPPPLAPVLPSYTSLPATISGRSRFVRQNRKTAANLNQIKDDPDLAAVWQDVH
jgi:hypothetical protein